jgi:hypothetical protein
MQVMDELEKKLKPTKATQGFTMRSEGTSTIACYAADPSVPFARAVVSVSEGFNGFRLYVGKMLVIEHNIGSESHILELCELARHAGASMPVSLDDWMINVIVRYVSCVKKTLRYMQHLSNHKDAMQQLYNLQNTFELKISTRVFDFYAGDHLLENCSADVLRVFTEMLESVHTKDGVGYTYGSSFREGDDEDDDGEDEFPSETIIVEDEDEIVDLLAAVSTPGLVAIFNHIANLGMGDFDNSEVYELSGIKRRIEIIHELCDNLHMAALVECAQAVDLKPGDAAIFAGR